MTGKRRRGGWVRAEASALPACEILAAGCSSYAHRQLQTPLDEGQNQAWLGWESVIVRLGLIRSAAGESNENPSCA